LNPEARSRYFYREFKEQALSGAFLLTAGPQGAASMIQ
jgi:hypothetical protein